MADSLTEETQATIAQNLADGPSAEIGLEQARNSDGPLAGAKTSTGASRYVGSKRQTIDSFVNFANGRGMPQWPVEVFLELSNLCDLKCAMCPTFSKLNSMRFFNLRQEERGFLDVNQGQSSLDQLLEHALVVHAFGYGEPTIHPEFREFMEHLSNYEVLIDFFTNGMHLNDATCDVLVRNRVSRITVSFSGSSKAEYENVYLGGVWETVLDGIARLAHLKEQANSPYPRIEINSIGFKHHIEKLPEFVDLMADRGANVIHVKPLSGYGNIPALHKHISIYRPWVEGKILTEAKGRAQQKSIQLRTLPYERTEVLEEAQVDQRRESRIIGKRVQDTEGPSADAIVPISELKEIAKYTEAIPFREQGGSGESWSILDSEQGKSVEDLEIGKPEGVIQYPCFEPFKTFYVKRDGNTKPCCFGMSKESYGNIEKSRSEDIWQGEAFERVREGIIQGEYPMATCKSCLQFGSAPIHHSVNGKFAEYSRWFRASFQEEFYPEALNKINELPDNSGIIERLSL